MKKTALAATLLLAGGLAFGPAAHAGYVVTITQVGGNVLAIGGGTINTADLTSHGSNSLVPLMQSNTGTIFTGPTGGQVAQLYDVINGPARFGSGFETLASSGKGDFVGITGDELRLPVGYVSGSALSDSATYDNQSFASLGLTPGSYTWGWGTGPNADSFTVKIEASAAVPEPSSLLLLATALIAIGAAGYCRRRAV